jgi:hypothetical protein
MRTFCLILPLLLLPSCAADQPAPAPPSEAATTTTTTTAVPTTAASAPEAPVRTETSVETRTPDPESAEAAVAVIVDYYRAIDAHDYEHAYRLWGTAGPPGQTLESFTRGFAETASVTVAPGAPSRIDAAAGSRYIEIPVTVTAKTTAGRDQRFTGTYTLRRAVVDGATPSQREWHFYRASLEETTQ